MDSLKDCQEKLAEICLKRKHGFNDFNQTSRKLTMNSHLLVSPKRSRRGSLLEHKAFKEIADSSRLPRYRHRSFERRCAMDTSRGSDATIDYNNGKSGVNVNTTSATGGHTSANESFIVVENKGSNKPTDTFDRFPFDPHQLRKEWCSERNLRRQFNEVEDKSCTKGAIRSSRHPTFVLLPTNKPRGLSYTAEQLEHLNGVDMGKRCNESSHSAPISTTKVPINNDSSADATVTQDESLAEKYNTIAEAMLLPSRVQSTPTLRGSKGRRHSEDTTNITRSRHALLWKSGPRNEDSLDDNYGNIAMAATSSFQNRDPQKNVFLRRVSNSRSSLTNYVRNSLLGLNNIEDASSVAVERNPPKEELKRDRNLMAFVKGCPGLQYQNSL